MRHVNSLFELEVRLPLECCILAAYAVRTDGARLALTIAVDGILFR